MRPLALVVAVLAALAATAVATGAPGGQVRVPHLVGLSRSAAEARITGQGLRYLLPTPRADRYEAIVDPSARIERAVPEALAPDRRVVAVWPGFVNGTAPRGTAIDFGTVLPQGSPATARTTYSPPYPVGRFELGSHGRRVTLHLRAGSRRCEALDHVSVGSAERYVTVIPIFLSTRASERHCNGVTKRVVQLDLPEPVRDRVVLAGVPSEPHQGLYEVADSPYIKASGQAKARAVAVRFGHGSGCGLLAGVRVQETSQTVTITLSKGNLGESGLCDAILITDVTVVPLRRPLGDRRIVDGAR